MLTLALIGCASTDTGGVPWDQYSPSLRGRIDGLQVAADCPGLQAEFDAADTNGGVELMKYVDSAMRVAGCYDG